MVTQQKLSCDEIEISRYTLTLEFHSNILILSCLPINLRCVEGMICCKVLGGGWGGSTRLTKRWSRSDCTAKAQSKNHGSTVQITEPTLADLL